MLNKIHKTERIYTCIPDETKTRLENYMKSLTVRPKKNQVVNTAIDYFLTNEGF